MSRIGKQPIIISEGVKVEVLRQNIKLEGPRGELQFTVDNNLRIEQQNGKILIKLANEKKIKNKHIRSLWGLTRSLIFNMMKGVTEGYQKQLKIDGVGYKAEVKNEDLILNLGFSHPIEVPSVSGIKYKVEKNIITVEGIDKQLVGQIAAIIRSKRKPEPYKGKGVSYVGEIIKRKAGKKMVGTE